MGSISEVKNPIKGGISKETMALIENELKIL
jgi:hypothetical protein